VHEEMKPRFDQVEQIGEEITRQSLEALAANVATKPPTDSSQPSTSVVVFNPSSAQRTDLVSLELSLPVGVQGFEILDQSGNVIPHQSASAGTSDLINVSVRRADLGGLLSMIHEGRAGNLALQDVQLERRGETIHVEAIMSETGGPNLGVWRRGMKSLQAYVDDPTVQVFHIHARSPEGMQITFVAPHIPALGWRTFHVRATETMPAPIHVTPFLRALAPLLSSPLAQKLIARPAQPASRPLHKIENDFFIVEARNDGTLTLTDKRDGSIYRGLNRFADGGDCGDEYNFCPPLSDAGPVVRLKRVRLIRGTVLQTLELDLELRLPAALTADRKARARRVISMPVTTRITLATGVARVDVQTAVDNHAKDHRLRVHFPAPFRTDSADYDGHFEIVSRKIGLPPFDNTWRDEPRPEVPQRAFTDVSDGKHGLMIANRGLPEVEVLKREDGNAEIALTLLRCVGWLSRDDFSTRNGHAGPFLATPSAQMQGTWTFDYSIIPHAGNWDQAFQEAYAFETAMRGVSADLHDGVLPASGSFLEVSPSGFVVSAIKESEARPEERGNGKGWLVRGVNLGDERLNVSIKPWRKFKHAGRLNLAEQKIGPLKPGADGKINLAARGHEIVTILLIP
jgi:mannosylglycerate hydrolase